MSRTARKPRPRAYGIMVRPYGTKDWLWVRADGQPTRNSADGASWHGENGQDAATAAARFMSSRLLGMSFKVTRKPTR